MYISKYIYRTLQLLFCSEKLKLFVSFFFSSLFLFYFNFLRNTRILPHHSYLPLFITFHHITLLHSFCQQHFILTHNTNPYLFSLFAALCLAVDLLLYLLFFLFIKSKIKFFSTLTNFSPFVQHLNPLQVCRGCSFHLFIAILFCVSSRYAHLGHLRYKLQLPIIKRGT